MIMITSNNSTTANNYNSRNSSSNNDNDNDDDDDDDDDDDMQARCWIQPIQVLGIRLDRGSELMQRVFFLQVSMQLRLPACDS